MDTDIDRGSSAASATTRSADTWPVPTVPASIGSTRTVTGSATTAMSSVLASAIRPAADLTVATAPGTPGTPEVAVDRPLGTDRIEIVARRTRMVPIATFEVPAVLRPVAPPDGWTDVLTGADGPRFWDRIVLSEQARVSRYHRPVTVAFAELMGLDRLAGQWGWDVAQHALAACARRLEREIRSSDHIARLEEARFGILLTETSEIAAINFVERARASCERELKATGDAVTIGFGWASPPDKGDLSDAIDLALTRLAAELAVPPSA